VLAKALGGGWQPAVAQTAVEPPAR
jgi:hypothetical protein